MTKQPVKKALIDALMETTKRVEFRLWIVGITPIIVHAWSDKARIEMLGKQIKRPRGQREMRDPEAEFLAALYRSPDGRYGIPAMAVKRAIVDVAHKDKGIEKTTVKDAVFMIAPMVRIRTAHPGAICDMPLFPIYGTDPEMREDPVKIGAGLTKTAHLAYRPQFRIWGVPVTGRLNIKAVPVHVLEFLVGEAGACKGIGDWRNEKNGVFGAFRLATAEEAEAWEKFAKSGKKSMMPIPPELAELEAAE